MKIKIHPLVKRQIKHLDKVDKDRYLKVLVAQHIILSFLRKL